MPDFPRLIAPIPVRFLTEFVRDFQKNHLDGPLNQAAANLVKDVLFRASMEDHVTTYVELTNRIRDEEKVPTDDELKQEAQETGDPIVSTLDGVIDGILNGESLERHHDQIKKYIMNQQDRSELISNLLLTKDYRRLIAFVKARDVLEQRLLAAATRADLNISETMALMQIIGAETAKLENRVQASTNNVSDILALMTKVDYTLQEDDSKMKSKLKGTTPAGREIIRRVIHKLKKVSES